MRHMAQPDLPEYLNPLATVLGSGRPMWPKPELSQELSGKGYSISGGVAKLID